MNEKEIRNGMYVKTSNSLGSTDGMLVAEEYLAARAPNKKGTVAGIVFGHGSEAWWIVHEDRTIGVYRASEFEPS